MIERTPIYLDHNASTLLLPRVREAVMRALDEGFANPSAEHVFGRRARAIVDVARAEVAALLGCDADEIVFTGGGTEANNLALRGLPGQTLVVSAVEHPALLLSACAGRGRRPPGHERVCHRRARLRRGAATTTTAPGLNRPLRWAA
jgi:cysteine sulfinate desulfinase/cysteine desulfurase-like protein